MNQLELDFTSAGNPMEQRTMKQETGRQQPGIRILKDGEDVKNIKTCRHCDIRFNRDDEAPIPHDRCERCHEEIEAMNYNPEDVAFKNDPVNHPAHYQSDDGIECIDAIRAALGLEGFVAHCRGTSLKYVYRAGKKGPASICLRKAVWYLEKAIEEMEQNEKD